MGMFEGMTWRFTNAANLSSREGDSHATSFFPSTHGALCP